MSNQNDELWLDVLAGKTNPTDAATRQAASLRRFFEQQAAEDLARAPDPEGEKRMLNMLRARGAFDERPVPASEPMGVLAKFVNWLLPPNQGHAGRYALLATVAFAVVVTPVLLRTSHDRGGDGDLIKSLPASPKGVAGIGEGVVMSAQPEREAAQLVALLAQAGVSAQVERDGADHVVRVRVPAGRIGAVNDSLANMGLAAPDNGDLAVRFRSFPK